MAKNIAIIFILGLFLIGPAHGVCAQEGSIVVQPSKFEISSSPGEKAPRVFSVVNRSNFYVRFKVSVKDYRQISEEGKLDFYERQDGQSASEWLVPQYIEVGLKPLETKDFGFVANVPENISSGAHYGAILFEPEDSDTSSVANNFGVLVLLSVSGQEKMNAIVKTSEFSTGVFQDGGRVDFSLKVQNSGNTHFSADGRLALKNIFGKNIAEYSLGKMTVYPGTSRVFKWRWSDAGPIGIYKAEAWLGDKMGGTAWFIVFPWQGSLAILFLALILAGWLAYRTKFFKKIKGRGMELDMDKITNLL